MSDLTRDLCSPSQLNLRFHCPGSAGLQTQLPARQRESSEAAERGTRLHETVVDILNGADPLTLGIPAEDFGAVEWCVEKINDVLSRFETKPIIKKEFQIDLSELGIVGGKDGCRIDILIIIPGIGSIVIDLKFGIGYVPQPKYNWQFRAYAWGAFKAYGGDVECIKLQPAVEEQYQYQTALFTGDELELHGQQIKTLVETAKGDTAPLVRGKHCGDLYCKARDICPLHRQAVLEIPQGITVGDHIRQISPDKRTELYENLQVARDWCEKAVKTIQALAIEERVELAGYEVGEGRKTYQWTSEAEFKICEYARSKGIPLDQIIVPATLASKSNIEKIIGKSKLVVALLEPLVVEVPGKPCLKKMKK